MERADVDDAPVAGRGKRLLELPSLLRSSFSLMWTASPGRTAFTLAVQTVNSLAIFVQVLLVKQVLDAVLDVESGAAAAAAVLPVVLLAALTALTSIAGALASLQQRVLGELVSRQVWRRVLDVSQSVELATFEDPGFYDQVQRVQANAVQQTQIVVQALVLLLGGVLGVVAGATAVLALAPALLPLLLLSGVPLFLTSRISGRAEFAFVVEQTAAWRERTYVQLVLTRREEAKEVRAFTMAGTLRRRWEDNYSRYVSALTSHVRARIRLALMGHLAAAALTAGTLLIALVMLDTGQLSIASAGAALIAVRLLGGRVGSAASGASAIYESALFLGELRSFLTRHASDPRPRSAAPPSFDRLSVEDVTFAYPGAQHPALQNVSLQVRRGEVVALVGANGSGKTTLAKLLANLYTPDSGAVRWDQWDLRDLEPRDVRRRISLIFQDFVRYKLTARDNIGLGRATDVVDDADVQRAARQADADGFLARLPHGLDTLLSKEYVGGADLSLGQWQRVALARAFIRDAPFVILDEPSASLDAQAEHDLFQSLRTLLAGRTVVVISHRFSTVRDADRIYVLDQGRVVEEGDHASLLDADGHYARLYRLQAQPYVDGAASDLPDAATGK